MIQLKLYRRFKILCQPHQKRHRALHKKLLLIILNIGSFEIVFRETVVGMSLRDTKTKCSLRILLYQRLLETNRAICDSFLFVFVDMKMA
jgi:hypothetical protein